MRLRVELVVGMCFDGEKGGRNLEVYARLYLPLDVCIGDGKWL